MDCEHCKKTFSNKSNLRNHQKTAKYCLKLQNKDINEFSCKACDYSFTSKRNLKLHEISCINLIKIINNDKIKQKEKECREKLKQKDIECEEKLKKIDNIKDEYERKIKDLQDRIQELAKEAINRPTQMVKTTTNNTTNNVLNLAPLNIDKEDFKSKIEEGYNMKYFLQGTRGVAEFAKDKLLTDENGKSRYVCVDPSRHIFKYVDENGETRRDVKASKFTEKVTPDIVNKANRMAGEERENKDNYPETIDTITNIFFDIKSLKEHPDKLGRELSKIM